jgi:hypothetical protein
VPEARIDFFDEEEYLDYAERLLDDFSRFG